MVLNRTFGATVITMNQCLGVPKLGRHWLAFDSTIEISELGFHIHDSLAANWTAVGGFRIFQIAFLMYTVPTPHKNHGIGRCKHVVAADRAVTLRGLLDTSMRFLNRDRNAYAASLHHCQETCQSTSLEVNYLAVDEILSESLPDATYAAVVAMINALRAVVVPQLAYAAVIRCGACPTFFAPLCRGLRETADHTEHIFGLSSLQCVIFRLVMAEAARVPLLTCVALEFDISPIVLTAQYAFLLVLARGVI